MDAEITVAPMRCATVLMDSLIGVSVSEGSRWFPTLATVVYRRVVSNIGGSGLGLASLDRQVPNPILTGVTA